MVLKTFLFLLERRRFVHLREYEVAGMIKLELGKGKADVGGGG